MKEWITVQDDIDIMHLSDGSTIFLIKTDFGFEPNRSLDGSTMSPMFDVSFEFRAGAMEAVRRWLETNQLVTVPSDEQRAQPWHEWGGENTASKIQWDHSYREKYESKPTRVVSHADAASNDTGFDNGRDHPPAAPAFDPLALAQSLNAQIFDPLAFAKSLGKLNPE